MSTELTEEVALQPEGVPAQEAETGGGGVGGAMGEESAPRQPATDAQPDVTGAPEGVDLSSRRLLVAGVAEADLDPKAERLGSNDGLWLLQYASEQDAAWAYDYYRHDRAAELVEPDVAVAAADEGKMGAEVPAGSVAATPMTAADNPVAELSDAKASGEAAAAAEATERDYVVALVDTGYADDGLVSATSVLGEATADDNGHGTAMAGHIREEHPEAKILSVKALDATGTGTTSSVYAAIEYAVEAKASIVDLSLSAWATEGNAVVERAIDDAVAAGVVVVGAAGNNGTDAKYTVPGRVASAVVAGAADADGNRIASSNYGDTVDAYVAAGSTSEAAARMSGRLAARRATTANAESLAREAANAE